MSKILIAIPAGHELTYGAWESRQSPLFDRKTSYLGQPYGENIHMSGPNHRVAAVRETWGSKLPPGVDLRFFYGLREGVPHVTSADEVQLTCGDLYEHLPQKTIDICFWALCHDYDYMLKVDDDTYVWVDRVLKELDIPFDYAGYMGGAKMYASGGPGYWLSRKAMACIAANATPHTWAEDVIVGETLRRFGIHGKYLTGHQCGVADHWFDISRVNDTMTTAHAVTPENMRKLWNRESSSR
jgi:hypothetical protein